MKRVDHPEAELFDGPAQQDRAYLLHRGQAGILFSKTWRDRHTFYVFREQFLAGDGTTYIYSI